MLPIASRGNIIHNYSNHARGNLKATLLYRRFLIPINTLFYGNYQ